MVFAHADSRGFGSAVGKKLRIAVACAALRQKRTIFCRGGAKFLMRCRATFETKVFATKKAPAELTRMVCVNFFGVELPEIAGLAEFGGGVDYGVEDLAIRGGFR